MSEPAPSVPSPSVRAAVGNLPFTGVMLASIVALIPWSRTAGIALLAVLAIPVLVSWCRARRLTDGSRGLTSSAAVLGIDALIIAVAQMPATPSAAAGTAPVHQAAAIQAAVTPAPEAAAVASRPAEGAAGAASMRTGGPAYRPARGRDGDGGACQ